MTLGGTAANETTTATGDVFIGWNSKPIISEHAADGTCVKTGQIGASGGGTMNDRAFHIAADERVDTPDSTPALRMTANDTAAAGATAFCDSWNGATEIAAWRCVCGGTEAVSPVSCAQPPSEGFEHGFLAEGYRARRCAEALEKDRRVWGNSQVKETYLPGIVANATGSSSRKGIV